MSQETLVKPAMTGARMKVRARRIALISSAVALMGVVAASCGRVGAPPSGAGASHAVDPQLVGRWILGAAPEANVLVLLEFRSDEVVVNRIRLDDVGFIRGIHVIDGRVYMSSVGATAFDTGSGLWSLDPSSLRPQPLLAYLEHSLTGPGYYMLEDSFVFTRHDGTLVQYDPASGNLSAWNRPGELPPGAFLAADGALMAGLSPAGEVLTFNADGVIVRRIAGLEPCSQGYMDIQDDLILLQCFDRFRRGDPAIWKRESRSTVRLSAETAVIRGLSAQGCSLMMDGAGGAWIAALYDIPPGLVFANLQSGDTQWTDGRWVSGPFIDDELARKLLTPQSTGVQP